MVWWIEVIGYLGMALVILSFLFKKMRWLRLVNSLGSLCCMTYGFMTATYPTAFLNLILFLINLQFPIIYFIKNHKKSKNTQNNNV